MEQPDEIRNHKIVPHEVLQKKREEKRLLDKEKPSDVREKLGQLISLEEYRTKKAKRWFLKKYKLPADATGEDIVDAMSKKLRFFNNATGEQESKMEDEAWESLQTELTDEYLRQHDLLPSKE